MLLPQGTAVGPILAAALEAAVPSIWVQGVDFYYSADPADNSLPRGTNEVSIQSLVAVLNAAAEFCPDADIVAAGFNQGTAVIAGAVGDAPATLRDRIVGVALFGYTLNPPSENNGQIPNYPPAQTTVFCPFLDFVCWIPSWTVSPAIYGFDALTGAAFLASRINTP
jgi:cutinase